MEGVSEFSPHGALRALAQDLIRPEDLPPEDNAGSSDNGNTLTLRVVAVFVIMVASLVGSLPPLYLSLHTGGRWKAVRILKAGAAGAILALAFIHVLSDSYDNFGSLPASAGSEQAIGFPWAALCCLFAVLFMAILENVLNVYHMRSSSPIDFCDPSPCCDDASGCPAKPLTALSPVHNHADLENGTGANGVKGAVADRCVALARASVTSTLSHDHAHVCMDTRAGRWVHSDGIQPLGGISAQAQAHQEAEHKHVHVHVKEVCDHSAAHPEELSGQAQIKQRALVVAYLMELGCVFHSVIIGIDLGLGASDYRGVATRMTVLCFHQLLEGVGLGAVVGTAGFSRAKALIMCVFYSVTTPIGIAIGIATSSSYDPDSIKAHGINGVFDGVSAGLLLYVGLVTLLMEEFSSKELLKKENDWTRVGMYVALMGVAGIMAAIGIWA